MKESGIRVRVNSLRFSRRGRMVPDDEALLSGLVRDVCFGNARGYFGLPLPEALSE